jgi:hypothetical protein
MKHLLNNLSSEEKNRILEQHNGGKTIDTSNFKRLLESKLGNVKPLINEQSTSIDVSLKNWGQEISEKLKGVQIGAYKVDITGKPLEGDSHDSYWIEGISNNVGGIMTLEDRESLYDINYIETVFNGHVLNKSLTGNDKIQLSIRFLMSKGFAIGVDKVSILDGKDFPKLSSEDFTKVIIPKIGKIQLKNPCFDGFQYFKNGGYTNMEELKTEYETFSKKDSKNNDIRLYKDKGNWNTGTGQMVPYNVESGGKIQTITWACSNGKLTISK